MRFLSHTDGRAWHKISYLNLSDMEDTMLYSALLVLMSSTFIMLRLGNGGAFPRPLSKEEEGKCVDRWVNYEDLEARNTLIEHNLRLVAHVIKNT